MSKGAKFLDKHGDMLLPHTFSKNSKHVPFTDMNHLGVNPKEEFLILWEILPLQSLL